MSLISLLLWAKFISPVTIGTTKFTPMVTLYWSRVDLRCVFKHLSFYTFKMLLKMYSKIFSFIARARGHLSLWWWIFLAHICFKSARKNVPVQLMKLTLMYCQKSRIFHKKRARTFAQIPLKPKNACNIHNSEFACKKLASYDNSKLCLTTV